MDGCVVVSRAHLSGMRSWMQHRMKRDVPAYQDIGNELDADTLHDFVHSVAHVWLELSVNAMPWGGVIDSERSAAVLRGIMTGCGINNHRQFQVLHENNIISRCVNSIRQKHVSIRKNDVIKRLGRERARLR
jgi:hypothetical protein